MNQPWLEGLPLALEDRQSKAEPVPRLLDGKQEARLIAMRLNPPPAGYGSGSLRLLAQQVVELGIVDSINHETVGHTLRKTAPRGARCGIG